MGTFGAKFSREVVIKAFNWGSAERYLVECYHNYPEIYVQYNRWADRKDEVLMQLSPTQARELGQTLIDASDDRVVTIMKEGEK